MAVFETMGRKSSIERGQEGTSRIAGDLLLSGYQPNSHQVTHGRYRYAYASRTNAALTACALLRVREIFPPLVLALIVIYLLNPVVTRLERRGVRRFDNHLISPKASVRSRSLRTGAARKVRARSRLPSSRSGRRTVATGGVTMAIRFIKRGGGIGPMKPRQPARQSSVPMPQR
jgi:hypothetical protein